MISLILMAALSPQEDVLERYTTARTALAEAEQALKGEADRQASGTCEGCGKPHSQCPTPEVCKPNCDAKIRAALRPFAQKVKARRAEVAALRRDLARELADLELDLDAIHDRIERYFEIKAELTKIGDNLQAEREYWERARTQAIVNGLENLGKALRDRFVVLQKTKKLPKDSGVRIESFSRSLEKVKSSWESYCKGKDTKEKSESLRRMIECVRDAARAAGDITVAIAPSVQNEVRLVVSSLEVIANGLETIVTWREKGWSEAAPEARKTLDSVRAVLHEGQKKYKALAIYEKALAIGVTAEEEAEFAFEAFQAHRALATFDWALDLNDHRLKAVQETLAASGREYERQDARRKAILKALQ